MNSLKLWVKQLRLYQWVKNLLVFIPLVASFNIFNSESRLPIYGVSAFAAFSLVSSAVYVINDLLDLANDRVHEIKRHRPIASGRISVRTGVVAAITFLSAGLALGYFVGLPFLAALLTYLFFTSAYSVWIKKITMVDCIALAGLYTLRVVAGGIATEIEISFWLLAFSVFFFLSLAWVKRYAELESLQSEGKTQIVGRGYSVHDMPLILVFGAASAFLAVLIFALYLDSPAVRGQYAFPEIGWLAIPFLLYLIGRMWFKAHRGQMNQDPILFLFRDFPSLLTVALLGVALITAHIGFGF